MDSAFIYRAANELVQNAGTRNIKQIARSCSLDISETSRIKDMLGLLSLYFDKPLILINRQLDKQTKQMVCGYALGHYLEHQLLMDLLFSSPAMLFARRKAIDDLPSLATELVTAIVLILLPLNWMFPRRTLMASFTWKDTSDTCGCITSVCLPVYPDSFTRS